MKPLNEVINLAISQIDAQIQVGRVIRVGGPCGMGAQRHVSIAIGDARRGRRHSVLSWMRRSAAGSAVWSRVRVRVRVAFW